MIRNIAKDVALQRRLYHARPWTLPSNCRSDVFSSSFHTSQSLYSPSTSVKSSGRLTKDEPPVLPGQRKPKVNLQPGPMKVKAETTRTPIPPPPPAKLTKRALLPSAPPPESLQSSGIREMIQHDIKHAEDVGVLAPTPADASTVSSIMHKALEITKFYFRGAKAIWQRRKTISAVKARIRSGGDPMSRSEHRLVRLQRQDVSKVIPFLVLAVVLEELIPVLAIYAPFMLPSTCILPAQQLRIEAKRTTKAVAAAKKHQTLFDQLEELGRPKSALPVDVLRGKDASSAFCSILRLPTAGFDLLRISRIKNHLRFIETDDQLLVQENLLGQLSEDDLNQALQERGFIVQGLSMPRKVSQLKWWLDSVKDVSPEEAISRRLLLLSRIH